MSNPTPAEAAGIVDLSDEYDTRRLRILADALDYPHGTAPGKLLEAAIRAIRAANRRATPETPAAYGAQKGEPTWPWDPGPFVEAVEALQGAVIGHCGDSESYIGTQPPEAIEEVCRKLVARAEKVGDLIPEPFVTPVPPPASGEAAGDLATAARVLAQWRHQIAPGRAGLGPAIDTVVTHRCAPAPPAPSAEGGELAEWADALEANAQDMRDGFEASEPDIRNAASAIRAHRCQQSAPPPAGSGVEGVDRDELVRAFMAAERVHSDRWRYLSERADWAEAEAMADVALAEIERQRGER